MRQWLYGGRTPFSKPWRSVKRALGSSSSTSSSHDELEESKRIHKREETMNDHTKLKKGEGRTIHVFLPTSVMKKILSHRQSLMLLLLLLSLLPCRTVSDETTVQETEDVFDDDDHVRSRSSDEWYMVLVFSLLFGFFITLFGAFVAYFSILEDHLMRRYLKEGLLVQSNVVSSEFARGGGKVAFFTKPRDNPIYICFCEYNYQLEQHYTVRIRKQLKAKQSDFYASPQPLSSMPQGVLTYEEFDASCCGAHEQGQKEDQQNQHPPPSSYYEEYATDRKFLELLILPGYERSAYPRRQVERACSLRHRLLPIGMVLFDLILAAFCSKVAADNVLGLEKENQKQIGWYAIFAFITLIVLELPLIHYCCHGLIVEALRDEYLSNGEYVPLTGDDASTISSHSDMYLSTPTRGRSLRSFTSPSNMSQKSFVRPGV